MIITRTKVVLFSIIALTLAATAYTVATLPEQPVAAPAVDTVATQPEKELTPQEAVAFKKLDLAAKALDTGDRETVVRNGIDVAGDTTLPDDIRAEAFIVLAAVAILDKNIGLAREALQKVLDLPNADPKTKADAKEIMDQLPKPTKHSLKPGLTQL